jgi:hypothetical protein
MRKRNACKGVNALHPDPTRRHRPPPHPGGIEIDPTTSRILASSSGSVENVSAAGRPWSREMGDRLGCVRGRWVGAGDWAWAFW